MPEVGDDQLLEAGPLFPFRHRAAAIGCEDVLEGSHRRAVRSDQLTPDERKGQGLLNTVRRSLLASP